MSDDQREVYDEIVKWIHGESDLGGNGILTIGGTAGTGKSTLLGVLLARRDIGLTAVAAYTGRAASVAKRKLDAARVASTQKTLAPHGDLAKAHAELFFTVKSAEAEMPYCGTLHKLLYRPILDSKEQLHGWTRRDALDRPYKLLVVDEASQVGDELLEDLPVFNIPIIAVGDHGQLPPVMARGELMKRPMLRLRKTHRQARGNPIIQLARRVRKTGELDSSFADGKRIVFKDRSPATVEKTLRRAYAKAKSPLDVMVLCWTNERRVALNGLARQVCNNFGVPRKGEPLICLKNMQEEPIYNGMRGILREDSVLDGWQLTGDVDFPEEGIDRHGLVMCAPQFMQKRVFGDVDELQARGVDVDKMSGAGALFDFGHALTGHRSQGSQADHVILFVEDGLYKDARIREEVPLHLRHTRRAQADGARMTFQISDSFKRKARSLTTVKHERFAALGGLDNFRCGNAVARRRVFELTPLEARRAAFLADKHRVDAVRAARWRMEVRRRLKSHWGGTFARWSFLLKR